MSSGIFDGIIDAVSTIAHAISDLLDLGLKWVIGGATGPVPQALNDLLTIFESAVVLFFLFRWGRYSLVVLGAAKKPEGHYARRDYDKLRENLACGGTPARLYQEWLTKFLYWAEKFFGDTGMADRTLLQHLFGLKKPAPLWTAPALKRCLLLALIYPVAAIVLVWAISGHVGPAESALALRPDLPGWKRGLAVAPVGFSTFASWRFALATGWKQRLVWGVGAFAGAVVGAFAVGFAFASVSLVAFAVAFVGAFADDLAFAIGFAFVGAFVGAFAGAFVGAFVGAFAGAFVGAFAGVFAVAANAVATDAAVADLLMLSEPAVKHDRQGFSLALFVPALIVACLLAADLLSSSKAWDVAGSLLFLGLLMLLNAPFDWASLGLTRGLLRRGLELGGWMPWGLALADALFATGIVALLSLFLVIGVQAFDDLAVHGGGEKAAVLPLDTLFDGIEKNPAAPEYWWVYALLLSSMIPSVLNLMIGGLALLRGIPGLSAWFLSKMPPGGGDDAMHPFDRFSIGLLLTGQIFLGAILGFVVQAVLAWLLVFHLMPAVGLDLLDVARGVADFDLPAKAARLIAGRR